MSNGTFINKDNPNTNLCYGCGMKGHLLKDCPLLQKIGKNRKFKMKKDNKKVMVAAWSDDGYNLMSCKKNMLRFVFLKRALSEGDL